MKDIQKYHAQFDLELFYPQDVANDVKLNS